MDRGELCRGDRQRDVIGSRPSLRGERVSDSRFERVSDSRFALFIDLAKSRQQSRATVIRENLAPDGTELSPMRISECRITLGFVAGREGDLEQAVDLGLDGLKDGRQSDHTS